MMRRIIFETRKLGIDANNKSNNPPGNQEVYHASKIHFMLDTYNESRGGSALAGND
jgi:hypothetical protein